MKIALIFRSKGKGFVSNQLSKQGQPQPHAGSLKAWDTKLTTVKWSIVPLNYNPINPKVRAKWRVSRIRGDLGALFRCLVRPHGIGFRENKKSCDI